MTSEKGRINILMFDEDFNIILKQNECKLLHVNTVTGRFVCSDSEWLETECDIAKGGKRHYVILEIRG